MPKPKLYTNVHSANGYKASLLAAFLGLDIEEYEVDFFDDEQHKSHYLALNPRGEVPTLIDNGKIFYDSAAILVYLAGKYDKTNTWWSCDAEEQASIASWLAFAASWIQYGLCTARAIVTFGAPFNGLGTGLGGEGNKVLLRESQIRAVKSLEILEKSLEDKQWLTLNRPTIADIAVFAYVVLAPMADIALDPYPRVISWIERIKRLPNYFPIPS